MKILNPYVITWTILTPVKGKATKKDLNALWRSEIFTVSKNDNEFFFHSSSKEAAISKVKKIKGLSRNYEVLFITDKQFGNSEFGEKLSLLATKKQLQERFYI